MALTLGHVEASNGGARVRGRAQNSLERSDGVTPTTLAIHTANGTKVLKHAA
ncbi:hypothetical protein FHW67_002381 [Herbaspirillum sp. Sphag1AN]|uniref:hypothetical protein n=1 Tax=unclassified Herbaspirillum TaxID=2624150 RepID=UPI0016096F9D|nr:MULTISPECIES: hypothetical protein [unclassified Herbaspirillum]MBB3213092.1 hypothetical protein [Herbaspirillum sp. Sphag1AN]MBB3246289.1 hypothetical protein [Herbaspirillum sp. Sphag64]